MCLRKRWIACASGVGGSGLRDGLALKSASLKAVSAVLKAALSSDGPAASGINAPILSLHNFCLVTSSLAAAITLSLLNSTISIPLGLVSTDVPTMGKNREMSNLLINA